MLSPGGAPPSGRAVEAEAGDLVSELVGRVSAERYRELVNVGRELAASLSTNQFPLGDVALEIEPMGPSGGSRPHDKASVMVALEMFAADIGVALRTVETYRWVSSRWPARRRVPGVSFTVHRTLASIPSDRKRWAAIGDPPPHPRTGARVWTQDAARRVVGQQVDHPVTTAEKVRAIVELARDEQVAVVAVDGLLRRPEVAFKVMADSVARHIVNQAQIDHATQSQTLARARLHVGTTEVVPGGRRVAIESAAVVVELVGACAAFAATATRVVPQLAGTELGAEELDGIAAQVARVRAAADWIEQAVVGGADLDDVLAALLGGA